MKRRRVIVFGAFDLCHPGHQDFLRQAKQFGDYLIAVVGRDQTIVRWKGRPAVESEEQRLARVKRVSLVDRAVLGYPSATLEDQIRIISELRPDVICLGYDQKPKAGNLKKILKTLGLTGITLVTLKPYHPEKFKSSIIREGKDGPFHNSED